MIGGIGMGRTLAAALAISTTFVITASAADPPGEADAHVAAVAAAQRSGYVVEQATNGCPNPAADSEGWPKGALQACQYAVGTGGDRREGYVVLLEVAPRTIASWIETACAERLGASPGCFKTVLACGRLNSGMMLPVAGNLMEDMAAGPWKNYFFRNGMTVRMRGQANATTEAVGIARQEQLSNAPETEVESIPSGLTRFWRTLPAQFAALHPSEGVPRTVANPADARKWLAVARTEILAALQTSRSAAGRVGGGACGHAGEGQLPE